jgi:general L-amino acid transport system permease protein
VTALPRSRRFWLQAALAFSTAAFFVWIAWNTAISVERESLHFGLGFLGRPAGFPILQTLIPFNESSSYGRAFVVGLLNTLLVAILGIVFSSLLGFSVGLARLAPNRLLRAAALIYVELFRNLPLLLILFFLYFGILRQLPPPRASLSFAGGILNNRGLFLPWADLAPFQAFLVVAAIFSAAALAFVELSKRVVLGAVIVAAAFSVALAPPEISWPAAKGLSVSGGVKLIPELVALTVALSLYTAAYIAEIVRAGLQSVPREQSEAAAALGFSPWQIARLIVIPQAMRLITPPLTSQYLNLTKNSSLAVAIAYPDLVSVFAGTALGQTGQAVEIISITMGVYLFLSLATAGIIGQWGTARWAFR